MDSTSQIISLLNKSHSVFHAVKNMTDLLKENGFREIPENERFDVKPGDKCFVSRNGSSVIAFIVPKSFKKAFCISATHNDSPTFALKPNPILNRNGVAEINVEPYGGGIFYSWLDRPLSIAGRVYTEKDGETVCHLVDIDEDLLVIPSLAIHQNREVNHGYEFNAAKDMVPLWFDKAYEGDCGEYLKKKCGLEDKVVSHDLFLYVREQARVTGEGGRFLLSPRLDDLSSAYANLLAFLSNADKKEGDIAVFASFDNEEVGSLTAQGADSDFLKSILDRLSNSLGFDEEDRRIALSDSMMLSVDNAHANHPNHPEKADATTHVALNGGVVLKYNADQKYTTSGRSAAYVKSLASKLGDPIQEFSNRSDMRGGSTLGNISNGKVSLLSADIGIAQLAMHSAVELCGIEDLERMANLLKLHYGR